MQVPAPGTPPARDLVFKGLLRQLRRVRTTQQQRLLQLRQRLARPMQLLAYGMPDNEIKAVAPCSSSCTAQQDKQCACAWWSRSGFDGHAFLAQHCAAAVTPKASDSNSSSSGGKLAVKLEASASKKVSKEGKTSSKQRSWVMADNQDHAIADSACPKPLNTEGLLARLLEAATPSQVARCVACMGLKAVGQAVQLLYDLPGGVQAASTLMQCMSAVVAVR